MADLPVGWKAKVCNETGDTFYYHKETKKTQWDKPLTRVASLKHEEKKIIGELAKIEVTRLEASQSGRAARLRLSCRRRRRLARVSRR